MEKKKKKKQKLSAHAGKLAGVCIRTPEFGALGRTRFLVHQTLDVVVDQPLGGEHLVDVDVVELVGVLAGVGFLLRRCDGSPVHERYKNYGQGGERYCCTRFHGDTSVWAAVSILWTGTGSLAILYRWRASAGDV